MGVYIKSLLFVFLNFITIIYGEKNFCPSSSSCGSSNVTVKYPFKFEEQQIPRIKNCTFVNLTCNTTDSTILVHIPLLGDFYVQNIDYVKQYIQLYDPANCLVKRLIDYSLDSSPFKADYANYTFYVCPLDIHKNYIHCLSNDTNITIATREPFMEDYRCTVIGSQMLPVDHDDYFLYLRWDTDDCKACAHGRWGSKLMAKIVAAALTMPGLVIMSFSCCSVFCFHVMRTVGERSTAGEAVPTSIATEVELPSRTNNTGLDESKIIACTELVVVSECDNSKACSICLEIYSEKERVSVISKCGHCFHANCIQQWLGKNGTCPVCRTCLSDMAS